MSGNRMSRSLGVAGALVLMVVSVTIGSSRVDAAQAPVGLGTATSFAVLGGQTVSNTGPSVITGDLGVYPGSAAVGFPPGVVNGGVIHIDAVALQAQTDLVDAYNDAAGRTPVSVVSADLGGQTLQPGVYAGGGLSLTGTLTLDGQGDPNSVFIFQAASTLITADVSTVALINGVNPCNVYWQVGSSTTLGTNSVFVGTVMALTSISATTGAAITGRLLARNGSVTLDSNIVTAPACAQLAPTTTTSTAATTTVAAATTTAIGAATTTAPGGVGTSTPPTAPPFVGTIPRTGSGMATTTGILGLAVSGLGLVLLIGFARRPRRNA